VLADQQNAIDGKLVATHRERVRYSAVDGYLVLARTVAADVRLRNLLRKHRDDLVAWIRWTFVLIEAFQIFAYDHIRV